ncbi:MAG TPA: DUF1223 domain-containing protein [Xanthobacteraceae bacterium]|nr:DUF1223 domain-containing protein [Xanthobacteraceae bacterium]
MINRRISLLSVAAAMLGCSTLGVVSPAIGQEVRAVIELFTSQGCDSCPPADKLIGRLSKDPAIIALTAAVDYWDYLGWKDTLALAGHGNRQRAYARVRGDRDVFTPQVIVSGSAQALGSDESQIERAIAQSRRNAATLSLPLVLAVKEGKLTVNAPAGKSSADRAEIWLCPNAKAIPVTITKGENKGRSIIYHNVVRRWIKLGEWTGVASTWTVPLTDFQTENVDQVAVILQAGTAAAPGTMLAAAMQPLR